MIKTVPEKMCDAEANTWEEAGVMSWLTCLLEVDHDGDHMTVCFMPCMTCGGFDLHFDDCPDSSESVKSSTDVLTIFFNDEGEYWCQGYEHRSTKPAVYTEMEASIQNQVDKPLLAFQGPFK